MLEEEMLEILKEVAWGEVAFDVMEKAYCLHHPDCDGSMQHSPECIVTKARRILQREGITLKSYIVTFEYKNKHMGTWNSYTQHAIGYSVEEVEERYKGESREEYCNLKVTFDAAIS